MPLNIISTPIGNLGDITLRAIETLKSSDLILAEDTRRSGILLKHYDIKAKLQSYNDNNKEKLTPLIIEKLKQNHNISLISDSGTPGISDPGFYIVREARKNNIAVSPIPGATASISALISSGFPTDKFTFLGFLSKKQQKRKQQLTNIKQSNTTTIIYESPYRIQKLLKDMQDVIPGTQICIARELTKKFEEFLIGTPDELIVITKDRGLKGEITVIISPE